MKTLKDLESQINDIKYINQKVGNALHAQLHHAMNSKWSKEDLSEYIKSESDVISDFDIEFNTPLLIDDIRSVQDEIIEFFGAF